MNTHLKGLIITALGVLFVVPDSLFVRLIDGDAASIAFWRGITAGSVILTGVLLFQGQRDIREGGKTGKHGLLYAFLIAITAPGFVFAVGLTSVANVVFIIASMPVSFLQIWGTEEFWNTLLFISGLYREEFLIEIEAITVR